MMIYDMLEIRDSLDVEEIPATLKSICEHSADWVSITLVFFSPLSLELLDSSKF